MKTSSIEYSNMILGWIQSVEDAEDAREFVRIALDSLEAGAEAVGKSFDRVEVKFLIRQTDGRV